MIIEKKFTTGSSIQTKFIIDSDGNMSFLSDFDSSPYDRFILVIDKNINNSGESKVKLIKSLLERHGKKIISYEIMPHESNKGIDQSIDLIKFIFGRTPSARHACIGHSASWRSPCRPAAARRPH